jgi:hypothetical protein
MLRVSFKKTLVGNLVVEIPGQARLARYYLRHYVPYKRSYMGKNQRLKPEFQRARSKKGEAPKPEQLLLPFDVIVVGQDAPRPKPRTRDKKCFDSQRRCRRKHVPSDADAKGNRKYIRLKHERDAALYTIAWDLGTLWQQLLTPDYQPDIGQYRIWLNRYSAQEIEAAINIVAGKYRSGHFGESQATAFLRLLSYVSGIMKNRKAVNR